jgi:lauroyl/myristoyl acyltransferase
VRGEDIVKAALARGKGVLILIAHFGNYDLMGHVCVEAVRVSADDHHQDACGTSG